MGSETKTGGREATTAVIPGKFALSVGMPSLYCPPGWRWTLLTSVARLESGHTPSRKHPEYWGGDVPWIGISDATKNHGRVIFETEQYTNELGIANSSARVLAEGTVCLSRTASVGYVIVMGRPMSTSQDFVNWVCSDELNPHYLKYILLGERAALDMFSLGTTHQTIYFPEVKAFHVCLPCRREQDDIVSVLGVLDEKIELNRQMNKTLESMARAMFKDWFVNFGPTKAKLEGRESYLSPDIWTLFPDRLDSEARPQGWKPGTLADVADLNPESWSRASYPDEIRYVDLSNTKWGNVESTEAFRKDDAPSRAQRILRVGDTILGTVRPGNGSYAFIDEGELTGSTGFAVLRPKQARYQEIVYLAATAAENIDRLAHLADGGAYPAVRPETVLATTLNACDDDLIDHFSQMARPLMSRLGANRKESRTLSATRDLVLPKLLSGEIRLRDAEKLVSEVA